MQPISDQFERRLGIGLVGLLALAGGAAMISLLGSSTSGLLLQGPAAVDPDLASELSVLFAEDVVVAIQRIVHVIGLALFLGLALVLVLKRGTSRYSTLAAVTLASLGVSLIAPITQLPGGPTLAKIIGAVTPELLVHFWGSVSGLALLGFLATFPDGRWTPTWTRWLLVGAAAIGVASLVAPGTFVDPTAWPPELQAIWLVGLPAAAVAAQGLRRRATQLAPATKPVIVSLVAALAAFILLWAIQPELTPGALDLVVVTPRLRAAYAVNLLVVLSFAVFLFPVSVTFSIVRYRLFDVDLIINRAIVYGAATAVVGSLFLAISLAVTTLARVPLSGVVTGQASGPFGVVLGVGVVLVFQPLRRRVQHIVDRRFYRERYDARKIVDRFADELAIQAAPAELENSLAEVVESALRPTYVRLHPAPLDPRIDSLMAPGGSIEKREIPDDTTDYPFDADNGVLVPLHASGLLTGVLELGPRASSSRYSKLDLDLLDQMARTAGPALQLAHEVELRERNAQERERAANELELARKIQQGLLPQEFPHLKGWSVDAFYRPAREVGGDFYDWIELPDDRLGIVIGDVSDKGIPAALVMATCRALLRSAAVNGLSPGGLLAEVNDRLTPDVPAGMFATCLVVFLDPSTGSIAMANAGHNLPFICDGVDATEILVRGMPLGLMPAMAYEEVEAAVPDRGSIVLTSDGLTEAHNEAGEMFGTPRVRAALRSSGRDQLDATLDSHRQFVGSNWEQEDDMTLVTVSHHGSS